AERYGWAPRRRVAQWGQLRRRRARGAGRALAGARCALHRRNGRRPGRSRPAEDRPRLAPVRLAPLVLLLAVACGAPPITQRGLALERWSYVFAVDPELTRLRASVCFEGAMPYALAP